jgi:hypothetical protein
MMMKGFTLKMEAVKPSKTMEFYRNTTRRYNPEYFFLNLHRRENLTPRTLSGNLVLPPLTTFNGSLIVYNNDRFIIIILHWALFIACCLQAIGCHYTDNFFTVSFLF